MATYIFQVNLNVPYTTQGVATGASSGASAATYKYGSWPDVASNQTSIAAGRSVWIPGNAKNDNRSLRHGDVFASSGESGFYLAEHYVSGSNLPIGLGGNQSNAYQTLTPPPPEGAVLSILWQSNGSYQISQTVLDKIKASQIAAGTVGTPIATGVYGGSGYTRVNSDLCTAVEGALTGVQDAVGTIGVNPSVSGGSYGNAGGSFHHT